MPTTAYVTHSDYALHTLKNHPENDARIRRIWQVFDSEGILDDLLSVPPLMATDEQILRVHDPAHLTNIRQIASTGGAMVDADTYVLPVSYDVGRLGAGGAIAGVDAVVSGEADNALIVSRPPGHHATFSRAMGFCLFANVAMATRHLQETYDQIERVMIVDYDVHHGNGTQDIFWEDPTVLFASTHQYPFYPGTGAINEVGENHGQGTTLNMPLRAGTGNEGFNRLYREVLWPAARRFKPDFILVSAGFDAHWVDPLAMLQLDLGGYQQLTQQLITMANELSEGRIAFVLEGGYDVEALAYGMLNVAHALQGRDSLLDPIGACEMPSRPTDELVGRLREQHQLD
ncbi:MAG: histone deacetylase [Chloroflexi bacterium]|nr:histone deacetylase [Chloroflexota bacterium]